MIYELEINKKSQYVKRGDIKKPTWFSLDNDIFSHPDFFKTTPQDFKVFVWVISVCSRMNDEKIRIDSELCADQTKIDDQEVQDTIEKLDGKRWSIIVRNVGVQVNERAREVTRAIQTDKQTHTTDRQTDTQDTEKSFVGLHPLIHIWNREAYNLSKVHKSNKARDKKIKDIWPQLQPIEWERVIQKINASDFCIGQSENSNGWKATFDWLLQKETYLKVMEGKYDNRQKGSPKKFGHERSSNEAADEFSELISAAKSGDNTQG